MALFVSGCAELNLASVLTKTVLPPSAEGHYKVGAPYQIRGVWYHPEENPRYDEQGIASWYGEPFHGRRTANGEIYDMNELTAAHTTLPMPVYVRVTNLENDRVLVLRVNDRGPFVAGRIIDVSRRAAQLLGFHRQGTVRVRVQVVDPDSRLTHAEMHGEDEEQTVLASAGSIQAIQLTDLDDAGGGDRYVQVGAYSDADNAFVVSRAFDGEAEVNIHRAVLSESRIVYRVRLGPYASRSLAESMRDRAALLGYPDAIVVPGS